MRWHAFKSFLPGSCTRAITSIRHLRKDLKIRVSKAQSLTERRKPCGDATGEERVTDMALCFAGNVGKTVFLYMIRLGPQQSHSIDYVRSEVAFSFVRKQIAEFCAFAKRCNTATKPRPVSA